MNIPLPNAVEAAIIFAQPLPDDLNQFCRALDRLAVELTDQDKERGNPNLAAAARILADEVERLRKEPTDPFVSDCCQRQATTAGKAGSTCWWECSSCRKPCRIVFPDNNTQPK